MESFIAHWNTLSESARQIIIVCGVVEVIVLALMINILNVYDNRGKRWPTERELENEENQEIG